MWPAGRWREGHNPIFLHHCEGAQVLFLKKCLLPILGGSGTSLPVKITPFAYNYHSFLTCLLPPAPGFLMAPTSDLVKCWWAMGSSVSFWRSLDAAPGNTTNSGERAAKVPIQSNSTLVSNSDPEVWLLPISPERDPGLLVVTFSTPTVLGITTSICGSKRIFSTQTPMINGSMMIIKREKYFC